MGIFKQFVQEMKRPRWEVPSEPGTTPVSSDHVRLYHQTSSKNLSNIRRSGIQLSKAKGYEGPKSIYADEKGFYGKPDDTPSVEFHVPKKDFDRPFVNRDKVEPKEIIATHKPWHASVRYIDNDSKLRGEIERGEHDDVLKYKSSKEALAVRFVKKRLASKLKGS